MKSLSCVQLFATLWTVAYQAPPSMGFSRQEYWSGLPFPSPGDLPNPGIKPGSLALEADALTSEPAGQLFFLVAAMLESMFLFFDHLLIAIGKIVSNNLPFLFEFQFIQMNGQKCGTYS